MRFLMLVIGDEHEWARMPPEEQKAVYARWGRYDELLRAGDHVRGGDELEPTREACRLRREPSGKVIVTDGPFTETKEVVGGYLLLEAKDRAEAIRLASECPGLEGGGRIELYPVRPYTG